MSRFVRDFHVSIARHGRDVVSLGGHVRLSMPPEPARWATFAAGVSLRASKRATRNPEEPWISVPASSITRVPSWTTSSTSTIFGPPAATCSCAGTKGGSTSSCLTRGSPRMFAYATHWRAEHAIRPAVVNRKICGGNRTPRGAQTQQILASVVRTARQRGLDLNDLFTTLLQAPRPLVPATFKPSAQ